MRDSSRLRILYRNSRNTFLYLGANILQFFISIFTLPIYSKFLSPEDFAVLGYFSAINAFFFPLFNLHLGSYYLTNYYSSKASDNDEELSFAISLLNYSNLLVGLIGFLLTAAYFRIFSVQFALSPFIFLVLSYLFLNKFQTFFLIDARIKKNGLHYFLIAGSVVVFNALFSLTYVVLFRWGAAGRLGGQVTSQLLIAAIILFLWTRSKRLEWIHSFQKQKLLDCFRFAWPLVLAAYSYYPIDNMDKLLLERLQDPREFGFYSIGLLVANFVDMFYMALYQSFEPDLYRFIHNRKLKKYFIFAGAYIAVLILIAFAFWGFSDIILDLLTSGRYTRASSYADIFVFALVFRRSAGLIEPIFNVARETKLTLIMNLLVGTFSAFSYSFFIARSGFMGANYSRVFIGLFYLLTAFVLFTINQRKIRNSLYG